MKPGSDLFVTDIHPEAYARGWRAGFRDQQSAVQVDSLPHSAEDILRAFNSAGCECITHVGLCLGEAEQSIFAEAGKQHLFRVACRVPAVLFCHLKQASRATGGQKDFMNLPLANANQAYWDLTAENYDRIFPESVIGRVQRDAVWREMDKAFQPGMKRP